MSGLGLERTEAAVLRAKLRNLASVLAEGSLDEIGTFLVRFLDTAKNAIASKGGVSEEYYGHVVVGTFMPSGKVGECELRAVEAARRILLEARRFNAESPKIPMELSIGIDSGQYVKGSIVVAGKTTDLTLGEALFTAEKLVDAAPVNSVVASETAQFRVGHLFKGRHIGEVQSGPRNIKMFELIL